MATTWSYTASQKRKRYGPPGVGKTHLEVALGREPVARGYTVQFTTAMELLGALVKAQQQGTLEMRLTQYAKPKLLIVDELGYLPLEPAAGHLFFQLISRRYEQGSVLISSNRPVEEWDEVCSVSTTLAFHTNYVGV